MRVGVVPALFFSVLSIVTPALLQSSIPTLDLHLIQRLSISILEPRGDHQRRRG